MIKVQCDHCNELAKYAVTPLSQLFTSQTTGVAVVRLDDKNQLEYPRHICGTVECLVKELANSVAYELRFLPQVGQG